MSYMNRILYECGELENGKATRSHLAKLTGVTRAAVQIWEVVPAKLCPALEKKTGIPCEILNPTVEWGVLRDTKPEVSLPFERERLSSQQC